MSWLQRAFDGHVPAFLASLDKALDETAVDLSDLDSLDDDEGHAICRDCVGLDKITRPRPLDTVTAVCGQQVVLGLGIRPVTCEACAAAVVAQVCPKCGPV